MPDLRYLIDNTLRVPVNLLPLVSNGDFRTIDLAVPNSAAGMSLQFNLMSHSGLQRVIPVRPNASSNFEWRHEGLGYYTVLVAPSGNSILTSNSIVQGFFSGVTASLLPFRGPSIIILPTNVVQQTLDGTQDAFARLGAPAGASTAADIASIAAQATTLDARADTLGQAVTAIRTVVDAVNVAVDTEIAAILADTDEMQQRLAVGGPISTTLAALAGHAIADTVHALAHSVRAHLIVLLDTARGEPGQGAPPASAIPMLKLDYLYKFTRNKIVTNNSLIQVFADDASTIDHQATQSDAAGEYTRGEFGSG